MTQAEGRILFGKRVTEFGQVRRILCESYARLLAAKLYGARAVDYVRSASREDRRYLLFTPITKMQVTTEGERIVRLLAEVISAKGFERDSYFEIAKTCIDGLPKLEGTVHVNRALTLKFLPQLPVRERGRAERPAGPQRRGRRCLPVRPGPDPRPREDRVPRLAARSSTSSPRCPTSPCSASRQTRSSRCSRRLRSTPEQMSGDLDFQQSLSQLFTLIPYAQLILEQAQLDDIPQDIVDLVFETLVRDFSATAIELARQGLINRRAAGVGAGEHTQAGDRPRARRPRLH